jgi:glycosyltransferase involved in cell wall biosynthesis
VLRTDTAQTLVRDSLASVIAGTLSRSDLVLLPATCQSADLGGIARASGAEVLVLLEGGAQPAPGWLEGLLRAFDLGPHIGLAGPSTNRCAGRQAVLPQCGASPAEIAAAGADLGRRFGLRARELSPPHQLAPFCLAVRRDLIERVEPVADRPGWEVSYQRKAAQVGFGAALALPASAPLISCIMPTRDRPEFALQAVRYFQRQDYPARELVIVDDGAEDLEARLPLDRRIRYVRSAASESLGAKRNRACSLACGDIVAHWDDDDWHGPTRLTVQVAPILRGEADVVGLTGSVVFDLHSSTAWTCTPDLHRRLFAEDVHGGTLLFRRQVWESIARYPHRSLAEDAVFLRRAMRRGCQIARLPADELFVYVRHHKNTWSFACGEYGDAHEWQRHEVPQLTTVDRAFYEARRADVAPRPRRSPRPAAGRPLVSCIMPTRDRRAFVPQAITCFLRQDYARRELVIVDDGSDAVADLVPDDPRVVYKRVDRRQLIGEMRNLACELARGRFIAHWDDDDWFAPHRLSYQIGELERHGADLCGTRRLLYLDPVNERAWLLELPARQRRRLLGGTLCYRAEVWSRRPFHALANGEDVRFLHGAHARNALALDDHRFYLGLIHPANTSPKNTADGRWRRWPMAEVRELLDGDLAVYLPAHAATAIAAPSATANL